MKLEELFDQLIEENDKEIEKTTDNDGLKYYLGTENGINVSFLKMKKNMRFLHKNLLDDFKEYCRKMQFHTEIDEKLINDFLKQHEDNEIEQ